MSDPEVTPIAHSETDHGSCEDDSLREELRDSKKEGKYDKQSFDDK